MQENNTTPETSPHNWKFGNEYASCRQPKPEELVAIEGRGGLGELYVDIYTGIKSIDIESYPIENPFLSSYLGCIEFVNGEYRLIFESSENSNKSDLSHKTNSDNRPELKEIEKIILSKTTLDAEKARVLIEGIKNAFIMPMLPDWHVFAAGRFWLQKSNLNENGGIHWHLIETIGNNDTGQVVILDGDDVYLDRHRTGKVKKAVQAKQIGSRARREIINCLSQEIARTDRKHLANMRQKSKNAIFLGNLQDSTSR